VSFFITGTDTDVGKTFFSVLLIRALRSAGIDAVGFKPIACGGWEDVDALVQASGNTEPREAVCPLKFDMPASPLTAACAVEETIDPARIIAAYETLRARHEVVIVEGVGGWLVPITTEYFVADLAEELALPVIVVVRSRVGALNHTLLTVQDLARRGLECAGLVLNHGGITNDPAGHSNRATLELLRTAPVLCELMDGQQTLDLGLLNLPGLVPPGG
jgi:dethiobiotin synthetase